MVIHKQPSVRSNFSLKTPYLWKMDCHNEVPKVTAKKRTKADSPTIRKDSPFDGTDISENEVERAQSYLSECHGETSDESDIYDDLLVEPPSPLPSLAKFKENRAMNRSYKKLRPKISEEETRANKIFSEMTLDEQGEFLSSKIAERFFEWVSKTGMENLRINEDTLKILFQVGMDNPSVRSLDLGMKELATVPSSVAEAFHNYEKSERAALHRQILWDARYENVPPRYQAFGKRHPKSHKAWTKNVKGKWFTTGAVSEDIISGRALWGELLETKVIEHYCKWLRDNPHYKRPLYLQKMGYLDPRAEDDKYKDEMNEEFKRSGRRNYWLFDKVNYLEEEEKFKEDLQAHLEIVQMLKE